MSGVVDDQPPVDVEVSLTSDDETELPRTIFVRNEDSREAMPAGFVDGVGWRTKTRRKVSFELVCSVSKDKQREDKLTDVVEEHEVRLSSSGLEDGGLLLRSILLEGSVEEFDQRSSLSSGRLLH